MAGAESESAAGDWHVLLCCTGSVASLKVPELARRLQAGPADGGRAVHLRVVSTEHARHFFSPSELPNGVAHLSDADEWAAWRARGDPVLHIALREWADLLLVAPLSANTLAKLAHGLADGLVACVARAWPLGRRPALVCPAMNTEMWLHPATAPQLATLAGWGYTVAPPVEKTLICGETGVGAMAHLEDICSRAFELLRERDQRPGGL
ncbi:phosphopantothenoylcysteine decarboxylase-like [Pollicipes pollicipes]|uniref:phosphopantothenoylcysteine decarboxylase-like n=1 Tax=Pollicipes pollicipes TaxID=41117 RepID=UPI001884BFDA|nr:phosphopantothenoylcysteine decarboxylase-like [Pollicipes pollicipes]